MTTSFTPPLPHYAEVKRYIQDKIHSGEWVPNTRIPSEHELVKQFTYSRMTINRALRELTVEGLLMRIQGVGTFVTPRKSQSATFDVYSIAAEIKKRGHIYSCQILRMESCVMDAQQALEMDSSIGETAFHSIIVHLENGIPVLLEDRLVNAQAFPDYLEQDFKLTTPHDYLSELLPISTGEYRIEAILLRPEQYQPLQLESHEPCLFMHRRTWSQEVLVTSVRLYYPGKSYQFVGTIQA